MKATQSKARQMAVALRPQVNKVLAKRIKAEHLRGICDAIQAEVLKGFTFYNKRSGLPITEARLLYMTDDDCKPYYDALDAAYRAAGFTDLGPGYCPALVAESDVRNAENELARQCCEFIPDLDLEVLRRSLDKFDQFIELTIGLVVAYPGYVKPTQEEFNQLLSAA